MKDQIQRSATRIGKYLIIAALAMTSVFGVSRTASALTFSTRQAQWNLAGLGYMPYQGNIDGKIGPKTIGATRQFQTNRCLDVDGAVGPDTTAELMSLMLAVQAKVGASQDGKNGPNTRKLIRKWQRRHGLKVDGQAGEKTMAAMGIVWKKNCPGRPTPPPTSQPCASGTKDLGIQNTYVNGSLRPSRLCAIPGFRSSSEESDPTKPFYIPGANGDVIVSYSASRTTLSMFQAAKRAGITMSARSSFRSMTHQEQLCRQDPKCVAGDYGETAKPGYSNHQSGTAIDINIFSNTGYKPGATCSSGRSVGRNDAVWNWLYANAHNYGFRQYAAEAWHWEVTARSANRC